MWKQLIAFAAFVVASAAASARAADGPPAGAPEAPSPAKLAEYAKKLADTSPRDAEAYYQIGLWCQAQGLTDQATKVFERAIAIDPDHPGARSALGYRALGTEWTRGSSAKAKKPDGDGDAPASEATPVPKAEKKAAAKEAGPKAKPKAEPDEGPAKPDAPKAEDMVAAKKKWAQEAAAKLGLEKFPFYEDDDFLIHTTFDPNSGKVRDLVKVLKGLKKQLLVFAGRPKGPVWPGKLHFIFMRASTECMRFSEAIDGQRFPEEEGFYTAGDAETGYHTVFSAVPEKSLGFLLGWTALDRWSNSDRYIGWWLRDGLAGLLAGWTDEGRKEKWIEQAFLRTGAEIQANFDSVTIFKLLETEGYKPNARELNQAEALTLVFYLYSLSPSRFQKVIEDLKSAEAPAPPVGPDKMFFSQFTAFQEKSFSKNYLEKLEKLNDKWKAFVSQKAAELEKAKAASDPKKNTKQQKTTGGGNRQGGNTKKTAGAAGTTG